MKATAVGFGLLALLAACGRAPGSRTESVFGVDQRHLLADGAPWQAIGRVEQYAANVKPDSVKPSEFCTGTMVAPDLVLTAAHCVVDPARGGISANWLWFRPGARKGKTVPAVKGIYAWAGTTDPDDDRGNDWGLIKLEKPLGKETGIIPVSPNADTLVFLSPVSLVGYSEDIDGGKSPSVHDGCRVHGADYQSGALLDDCDMNPGASGGPLLVKTPQGWVVAAVNVAELGATGDSYMESYSDAVANLAVRGSRPLARINAVKGSL